MISIQRCQAYQQRSVRDLAWALFNPCLFHQLSDIPDEWLLPIWQDDAVFSWLEALDNDPSTLLEHLKAQRATRLGIYFEQLLSFYFAEYPRFSLIAKNLQANSPQRTIGEYDFIVWDKLDLRYYHIEVAVKFYIGIQQLDREINKNTPIYNWHLWVGPNKKDTLGIKMNHLIHHQLRLSDIDAGKNALASIGLSPEQLTPKLLLAGRLYYPEIENSSLPSVEAPLHSNNTNNPHSVWISPERLPSITLDNARYIILPRQLWMSKINASDITQHGLEILTDQQLITWVNQQISNDHTPLHIAEIDLKTHLEQQRFFIISD
jgi:hypothetical protein